MTVQLYTADQLISSVRIYAGIGTEGVSGADDATILTLLNEEMYTLLIPGLMKTREDYLVASERFTLSTTTNRYRVPHRAVGQKLRDIHHIDESGNRARIERLSRDDLSQYNEPTDSGRPSHYYLEGSWLVLIGQNLSGSLELAYHMRPGQIVESTDYRTVSSVTIGTTTTTLTLSASATSAMVAALKIDIHSPNSGADLKEWDVDCDEITSNQIVVTGLLDGSTFGRSPVEAGDYVCLPGEAALPALPRELHPILALAAAVRLRESLGDIEGTEILKRALGERLSAADILVSDRMETRPVRIINRNNLFFGGQANWGDW